MGALTKKVLLVLGASSDLGIALIHELEAQQENCVVLAHYSKNNEKLSKLQAECSYVSIQLLAADLSEQAEVCRMIGEIRNAGYSPTRIVSFAAADYRYMRISEWKSEIVRKDMEIQVYALAEVFRAFLPEMAQRGEGKAVVMLSSCTLGEPPKFLGNYTTVKYALLGLLKSAAAEYGESGLNINGVSPAMIETKFVKGVGRKMRELNADQNPRHRNLTVDDVIPAVLYLLSDQAEFMNGVNLNLSGRCE